MGLIKAAFAAGGNSSGAFTGFLGMNMAQQAGGVNAAQLYKMAAARQEAAPAPRSWTCSCGHRNTGKFCTKCGAKRFEEGWVCSCDKCGWQPEDPAKAPKFCPRVRGCI